ncbi:MAG TPA: RluA family pseudouridine synthase [bacterium]|nr:RluA family pseudouridine synthase [bacterium]
MRTIQLKVPARTHQRIDKYLSDSEGVASRSQIQRLVRLGLVLADGRPVRASHRLRGGERITVEIPEPEPSTLEPEPTALDIVYEDRFLLVVNKPPGMVVHPGSGVHRGTLANALLAHCKDLSGIGGVARPGIVHRLDKGTSGLMVVAKDDRTHLALSQALARRQIKRTYEAIVWGRPARKESKIETLIGRSPADRKKMAVVTSRGRQAVTTYHTVEEFEFASRLLVHLGTGRTHQIRVHLQHVGHPVFGDPTYGGRPRTYRGASPSTMARARVLVQSIERQALHARELVFSHPADGRELKLVAPLPPDMQYLLDRLRAGCRTGGPR